ncbi:MAG: spore germination protein [Christensenellaceae bacterium]|jgi:spore germination protein KA|nr:spore germination protein [Christensenellaceae bacterium]
MPDNNIKRAIAEPPTNSVVMGPREGFIEDIATNCDLIIKRIPHDDLVFEDFVVGKYTETKIKICYIKSIAHPKIIKQVKERISKINIDGIIDSSYIAAFLNPHKLKFIKSVSSDEKPDVVVSKLLEGRVSIIVDGSPIVLSVPYIFIEDLQNSNDYYGNSLNVSLKRIIRFLGILVALLLPAFYISIELHNNNILPQHIKDLMQESRGNSFFPPFIEIILVLLLFDMLYEANVSMPKSLGGTASLIGAIVIGDVATSVGLISAPVVLVAAVAGLTACLTPNLISQIGFLRLLLCVIGGFWGLLGVGIAIAVLLLPLLFVKNYGAHILAPIFPLKCADMKDALTKSPIDKMIKRPESIPNINPTRQKKTK